MLQLVTGYTFATLTGLLAVALFAAMFLPGDARGECFIMFVLCALLSVLFAWMAGI